VCNSADIAALLIHPIEKTTVMLIFILILLITSGILFFLHEYALKLTGLKDSVFYCKCDGESWIAETAWLDHATGQVCKITTKSNWQDGVTSVLNSEETVYHTKQPFSDRHDLQRFHRIARARFFLHLKWRSLFEKQTFLPLTRRA
jgi:hypothetical protein